MEERAMYLAGIPVQDDIVLELARLVDDPDLAARLEDTYGSMTKVLALTIPERETITGRSTTRPPASRN